MKVTVEHIHAKTATFTLKLHAETPEDARTLDKLHKEHLTAQYGSGERPQAVITAKAVH